MPYITISSSPTLSPISRSLVNIGNCLWLQNISKVCFKIVFPSSILAYTLAALLELSEGMCLRHRLSFEIGLSFEKWFLITHQLRQI